jgi:calcineurin-like phosphoesterase family protein
MKKNKIWFCSDTHYGHKNLCLGETTWTDKSGCRNFQSVLEMNDAIVNEINSKVGEDDILYLLGDFSFGGISNIFEFRKKLNVSTIHLVLGNHDEHIQKNKVFEGQTTQELFSSINNLLEITIEKQKIVLCHFPLEEWNFMDNGSWHLHGHCHGNLPETEFKRIDVGFDANDFKILSFEDVKEKMLNKINKKHIKSL